MDDNIAPVPPLEENENNCPPNPVEKDLSEVPVPAALEDSAESHPVNDNNPPSPSSTSAGGGTTTEEIPAANSPANNNSSTGDIMTDRDTTQPADPPVVSAANATGATTTAENTTNTATTTEVSRGRPTVRGEDVPAFPMPARCINPASDVNTRLDTQVEVRVYPCNNSNSSTNKKRFTSFTIKPEGVVIQGSNRARNSSVDLGAEYAMHVGRKLQRYELSDTRACQLLVTTHGKSFWVVPAPEAFSRHSGTCRLLGDRKHPPAAHTLQVGDFLRVGSVGVVVIETHDGVENRVLSEERIQKIMKDTTNSNGGGFLDLAETDGGTLMLVYAWR
jgi:hypothetical protein